MGVRRPLAVAVAALVVGAGSVLVAPGVASADGITAVAVTCKDIPFIGTTSTVANVEASDNVDPVIVGGAVTNTLHVPVPVADVPIAVIISEVKLTVPIPTGVTINDVTFTASSFPTQTWAIVGTDLVATLKGSVPLGGGAATPVVPDVKVKTTVAGPARTVQWKVPKTITAKASSGLTGTFTATCTPDNPATVLISTVVKNPNSAPTATDQTVPVAFDLPTPIVLSGTDPDADALTFSVTSTPAHGTVTGVPPTVTYTPSAGYVGPDSFTFTASDGHLSDAGLITLNVSAEAATVPGSPSITGISVAEGQATVTWTPPSADGGTAITGFQVVPVAGGVEGAPTLVGPAATSATVTGLTNGVTVTLRVAAVNAVGPSTPDESAAVTPQWWLPWSTGAVAIDEMFTWLVGHGPTTDEKNLWLSQLSAGTKLPGDLFVYLRNSTDALNNMDPTIRLYSAYLTRVPDAGGLNFWLGRRRTGWTLSRISSNFAASSEFKTRYGSMTNRQFVLNIYTNVLGRVGETSGVNYWTGQLDNHKKNRGQVMINFSESNEYKNKQVNNTHAAVVFIYLLGKTPTTVQRDAFVAQLVGGTPLEDLVRNLIHQPSFDLRAS